MLKFLSAALSIALRVASFKPNTTLPSLSAAIVIPAFAASAVAAVPSPDTKFKPFCNVTVLAFASSALLARYVIDASKLGATTFALPKSTVAGVAGLVPSASFLGFKVMVASPFLITRLSLPLPAISLILPRFSANFTSRSLLFFTTLMLFVSASVRVKLSAPLIVKVSPKLRCTLPASVVSLPVKSNPLLASAVFALLIRPSNLLIASPTFLTASVPVPSSFVMLYVGPVKEPSASTLESPPSAVARSDFTVCNCPPFTASLESAATLPSAMLDKVVGAVVSPLGFTTRACGVVTSSGFLPLFSSAVFTVPSAFTSSAL